VSELVDQYHSYRECHDCGRYCEVLVANYGDFFELECMSCGFAWAEVDLQPPEAPLPAHGT
jgi:uncharacterized Zn finger protein